MENPLSVAGSLLSTHVQAPTCQVNEVDAHVFFLEANEEGVVSRDECYRQGP